MLNINLAIVIPAYKRTFLRSTLRSLSNQSNKSFNVYIGDDCSPHDLEEIVKEFKDHLNIVYRRFERNLGSQNLVSHWERCIGLTQNEEWIWLFSDDDLMDPDCVQLFYDELQLKDAVDLFHLNVDVIDENDEIIERGLCFDHHMTVEAFFKGKSRGYIKSYVVEYIFRKSAYQKCNGFQLFDLAWFSDDATWMKLGLAKGIHTISGARVKWRRSGENISPNISNEIVRRKIGACIDYFVWLDRFVEKNDLDLTARIRNKAFRRFLRVPSYYVPYSYLGSALLTYRKRLTISYIHDCIYLLSYRITKQLLTILGRG
ncbi:glycosyltransferase family 2 protein [Marinoscillum sp. MHG1-6]|uniref:glycosyltransferase family 2 protein n=1 Tax=Marinoscillum sp. MHG1-6 TaxID=2959627 RepID=UPI0021574B97|nr:glycosyltransferase family 2 protein [Marinoscillum sp. MHG1-6]